jgi:Sep-tRNA:Cys-tRNA synthetase
MALMASFPYVQERVKKWDEEVKKAQYLVNQLEKIDIKLLGERPKNHDLIKLDTPVYDKLAKEHKKKGYFLYYELKDKGIIGIKPGRTQKFKISTYGLSWEQVSYVAESFLEIGGG